MAVLATSGKRTHPGRTIGAALLLTLIWFATPGANVTTAQVTSTPGRLACAQLLPMVEQNVAQCSGVDRDQACYGNRAVNVEYAETVHSVMAFAQAGDIVPLNAIKSISTGPLNLTSGEWGLAVLKVQTALPDTTAGQAVTFVLYGDTHVTDLIRTEAVAAPPVNCTGTTNRVTYLRGSPASNGQQLKLMQPNSTVKILGRSSDRLWVQADVDGTVGWLYVPTVKLGCDVASLPQIGVTPPSTLPGMSGFYFTTGLGAQAACRDIPSGGLLVASPKGMKVTFRANGADITMGSIAVFYARTNDSMAILPLEGQITVVAHGLTRTVRPGQIVSLPLGGPLGRDVIGPPGAVYRVQASTLFAQTVCRFAKAAGLSDVPCNVTQPNTSTQGTRVPGPVVTRAAPVPPTPTQAQAAGPVCTFTVQRFAADQNPAPVNATTGQHCTTMRWDVEGVETVYFNGQGVVGHGSQFVCMRVATTYTLTMNCGGVTKSVSYTVNTK
jgi:hypothetical protein